MLHFSLHRVIVYSDWLSINFLTKANAAHKQLKLCNIVAAVLWNTDADFLLFIAWLLRVLNSIQHRICRKKPRSVRTLWKFWWTGEDRQVWPNITNLNTYFTQTLSLNSCFSLRRYQPYCNAVTLLIMSQEISLLKFSCHQSASRNSHKFNCNQQPIIKRHLAMFSEQEFWLVL